jgi:nitrite reductase (NO-forming)
LAGILIVVALVVAFVMFRPSAAQDATTTDSASSAASASGSGSGSRSGSGSAGESIEATGKTTTAKVAVEGMSFTPSDIKVPAGNKLVITFTNTGNQRHDLVLSNGAKTPTIAPGDTATLEAGVITSSLEGWCSLPGHRQMGMSLTITMTGTGAMSGDSAGGSSGSTGSDSMEGMDMGDSGSDSDSTNDVDTPTMAALQKQAKKEKAYDAELTTLDNKKDRYYTLTVTEGTQTLSDGVTRQVWTYNKTSPAPTLHGHVGDTFHVTLVNKGTMGHSIDFHAGQNNPKTVMKTIDPGQSLEYVFTASHAGIWLYHCSTMPMSNHIANGMYGAVVIEPKGLSDVTAQYVLVQGEMYLGKNGGAADANKVASLIPDIVTFNGRAFQYDAHPLTARAGKRIRIWVLDAGPNAALSFHIVGAHFNTVWKEGAYLLRDNDSSGMSSGEAASQALGLQPAEGGFVELTIPDAGSYTMVNHIMSLAEKGAHGTLKVTK